MKLFFASMLLLLPALCLAQSSWKIETNGDEITMKNRFDPDPTNRYRGEIDSDGSVRMRDMNGNFLRGNIDQDGYGTLKDLDGNTVRVRPE